MINLEREKNELKKRIFEIKKENLYDLNDDDFFEKIKYMIENLNIYDERAIKSDFSYNLAHIDEYRPYAIQDYKL